MRGRLSYFKMFFLLFLTILLFFSVGCTKKETKSEFLPSIDLTGNVISDNDIDMISQMKVTNENLAFQANKINLPKLVSSKVHYAIKNSKDTIQHFTVTFKCRDFDLNQKYFFQEQKVEVQPKDTGIFIVENKPMEGGMIICDVKAVSEDLVRSKRIEFMLS